MNTNAMPSGRSSFTNSQKSGDIIPKGYRKGQIQQFSPEQMQLFEQLFSNVSPDSYLSKLAGGDESFFDEMEAPYWKDFQEAQGQLGSRFSGLGMGSRNSSAFQNAGGQLGSDFAMQLGARRHDLRRQALEDLMRFSESLLGQRPNEQFLTKKAQKDQPFWKKALGFASPVGGDIASGGTQNTTNFLNALMSMGV